MLKEINGKYIENSRGSNVTGKKIMWYIMFDLISTHIVEIPVIFENSENESRFVDFLHG